MTNQERKELRRRVAVEVMGWQLCYETKEGNYCIPNDDSSICKVQSSITDFRPDEDANQTLMVIEQMFCQREDIFDLYLEILTKNCPVSNNTPAKVMGWWLATSNKLEAICQAALKAVEGKEEK